ncbi:plastid transcriptionally active 5 [Euphorbia peplus]|nr:plastid transcriptionally active 5 [Euphorbia peplus]
MLGFYSGEEDMEFSSFSSGTERAVKTWQASLSIPDDGIMTTELLERLYMEPQIGSKFSIDEKGINLSVSQEVLCLFFLHNAAVSFTEFNSCILPL